MVRMPQFKRLCAVGVLFAAGCSGIGQPAPSASPPPTPVPFAVLSSANVASLARLGSLQMNPGATAACSLQSDAMVIRDQQTLTVYRVSTLAKTQSIQADATFPLVAVSPDGQRVAAANVNELQVWDAATAKTVRFMRLYVVAQGVPQEIGMYTINLDFGPQHWIAVGAAGKAYDVAGDTGQVNWIFGGPRSTGSNAVFSPDGQLVALANSVKGTVYIWGTSDGQPRQQLSSPAREWLSGLTFSADGSTLAAGDDSHGVYFWDTHTWQLVTTLPQPGLKAFALSADGALLFGVQGSQVAVWEVKTGRLLRTVDASSSPIQVLQTCLDGRFLLASGQAGNVDVWGFKS